MLCGYGILFHGAAFAVQLESFAGGIPTAACILRTDTDTTCHAAAIRAVIFTIFDCTVNMLDFFLFHSNSLLSCLFLV